MRMPAFYALVRGVAVADYWHDNDECFIVKSIVLRDRLPGHDDRGRCPYFVLVETRPVLNRRPEAAI